MKVCLKYHSEKNECICGYHEGNPIGPTKEELDEVREFFEKSHREAHIADPQMDYEDIYG